MAFGKLTIDWRSCIAAVWRSNRHFLKPISSVDLVKPESLVGIDTQKDALFTNTEHFLRGKPASHALLWGASGVGKSSLIKAVLTKYHTYGLRMIQLPKDKLNLLVDIIDEIADASSNYRFIIYCDDLTFEEGSNEYRLLKSNMDGTLEKPAENVLVYATSNRRHLLDAPTDASPHDLSHMDADEEDTLALADRFGLTLAFPVMSKETYLAIVDSLFKGRVKDVDLLHQEALNFAQQRGNYSGRIARYFYNHCQACV